MSADRIAAQLAHQPGLGSAGPAAMPTGAPQAAPAIVTLLPGICADIHLGVELPRRVCGDWDGLDAAPAWFRDTLVGGAAAAPTIQQIVYRDRTIGTVTGVARSDSIGGASLAAHTPRGGGGLALDEHELPNGRVDFHNVHPRLLSKEKPLYWPAFTPPASAQSRRSSG